MNQQPFYHEVTVIFTADHAMEKAEVMSLLRNGFKGKGLPGKTMEIESMCEPEPGDPADLI